MHYPRGFDPLRRVRHIHSCSTMGALSPIQPPQSDFCVLNPSMFKLGLGPEDVLPPFKALQTNHT